MKAIAAGVAVVLAVVTSTCARPRMAQREAPAAASSPPPATAAGAAASAAGLFKETVAPVLARRCAPCHNPGGKMYATHPWDDAPTVLQHKDGILRRIKDGDDRAALDRWLAAQP